MDLGYISQSIYFINLLYYCIYYKLPICSLFLSENSVLIHININRGAPVNFSKLWKVIVYLSIALKIWANLERSEVHKNREIPSSPAPSSPTPVFT